MVRVYLWLFLHVCVLLFVIGAWTFDRALGKVPRVLQEHAAFLHYMVHFVRFSGVAMGMPIDFLGVLFDFVRSTLVCAPGLCLECAFVCICVHVIACANVLEHMCLRGSLLTSV